MPKTGVHGSRTQCFRSRKATTLVEDARTRASEGAPADDADAALVAFDPPPTGHRDWLTVELPGI